MRLERTYVALARPVDVFHERVEALDAAMVIARASPKKGPVHSLRTAARCVEAQLSLLEMLPGLPPHKEEADEVRKRLKKVRRATGVVRDLDVQRDLIQRDVLTKTRWGKDSRDKSLRSDALRLRRHLKRRREQMSMKMVKVLCKEEGKLALALLSLEDALETARNRILPVQQLAARIERWFHLNTARSHQFGSTHTQTKEGNVLASPMQVSEKLDRETLHELRKRAKLCRYMVESLPLGYRSSRQIAIRFRDIHEAGGNWHDWLLLEEVASERKGKQADLTKRYAERRLQALGDYRSQLMDSPRGAVPAQVRQVESRS